MATDATVEGTDARTRRPLSRDRILRAAVDLADEHGLDAVTMRRLGEALGVEAMSLYNHVENKRDLLDGMFDQLLDEIDAETAALAVRDGSTDARDDDWRTRVRRSAMAAHGAMRRHSWGPDLVASRTEVTPKLMTHYDGIIGMLLDGGFPPLLTHHAVHALGSRMLGFNQELFVTEPEEDAPPVAVVAEQLRPAFPNLATMMTHSHVEGSAEPGCDTDVEFQFALDLLLDGLEARRIAAAAQS